MIPKLDAEIWLVNRVKQHIGGIFDGETSVVARRDRLRKVIRDNGIACVITGRHDERPETYEEAFARIYGEAL